MVATNSIVYPRTLLLLRTATQHHTFLSTFGITTRPRNGAMKHHPLTVDTITIYIPVLQARVTPLLLQHHPTAGIGQTVPLPTFTATCRTIFLQTMDTTPLMPQDFMKTVRVIEAMTTYTLLQRHGPDDLDQTTYSLPRRERDGRLRTARRLTL